MLSLSLLQQLIRWRWLRNVWFHSERDDAAAYLHCLGHLRLKLDVLLGQHEGSELAEVVLQVELAIDVVVLNQSMAPADRDVTDSDVTLVASA